MGLEGVLTEHHCHGIVDVMGRDVAVRVDILQSLDKSLFRDRRSLLFLSWQARYVHLQMRAEASRDRVGAAAKRRDANEDDNSAGLVLNTDVVARLIKRFRQFSDLRPGGTGVRQDNRLLRCNDRALIEHFENRRHPYLPHLPPEPRQVTVKVSVVR